MRDRGLRLRRLCRAAITSRPPYGAAPATLGNTPEPQYDTVQQHHFALIRRFSRKDAGIRRILELLEDNASRLVAETAADTWPSRLTAEALRPEGANHYNNAWVSDGEP